MILLKFLKDLCEERRDGREQRPKDEVFAAILGEPRMESEQWWENQGCPITIQDLE